MTWRRVCILGVGLLGGSVGLRLRRDRLATEVTGFGRDPKKLDTAVRLGAIDRGATELSVAARDADLVIACTPVQQIVTALRESSRFALSSALLTDVGSTKASIVAAMSKSDLADRFIGSHPIAGSDKSGVEYADASLFDERMVIVTPAVGFPYEERVIAMEKFWQSLGRSNAAYVSRATR